MLVFRLGDLSVRMRWKALLANTGLAALLLVLAGWALTVGSRAIDVQSVVRWMVFHDLGATDALILGDFRAPRICLAMLAGAMLALAGAVTQYQTRNGLADPSLLGVREGASLFIVALLLVSPAMPLALRPVVGLAGGLAAGLAVALVSRGASPLKFVMTGFGISWCLSSMLVILLASADLTSLQSALLWLAGSLQAADWQSVRIAAVILVFAGSVIFWLARHTELDDMGEAVATVLGTARSGPRRSTLMCAVLLVAGSVSVVGGLGFVGLIAPHIARFLPRQSLRGQLVASMMIGALLVLAADTLGRTIFAPVTLPAGISLAAIGAPLLVLLLWLRRDRTEDLR
ncbi:iron ABC transporter permease [Jiella sp. MQZ9-1]|nr:iron ABC transporter permease [Jiella flava]